jgi:hypothetical protein
LRVMRNRYRQQTPDEHEYFLNHKFNFLGQIVIW